MVLERRGRRILLQRIGQDGVGNTFVVNANAAAKCEAFARPVVQRESRRKIVEIGGACARFSQAVVVPAQARGHRQVLRQAELVLEIQRQLILAIAESCRAQFDPVVDDFGRVRDVVNVERRAEVERAHLCKLRLGQPHAIVAGGIAAACEAEVRAHCVDSKAERVRVSQPGKALLKLQGVFAFIKTESRMTEYGSCQTIRRFDDGLRAALRARSRIVPVEAADAKLRF